MNYILPSLVLFTASCDIFAPVKCYDEVKSREKRYLVYPRPGVGNAPTKVQLIMGLGLPMEDGLIIGYVLKHNYNLPYNATFFTNPYIRLERSIDYADKNHRRKSISYSRGDETLKEHTNVQNIYVVPFQNTETGDSLVWIYRVIRTFPHDATHLCFSGLLSRWEMYAMLGSAIDVLGTGKTCLLRAICETARLPFGKGRGLLGEILHAFLTPSTTSEEFLDTDDQEYFAAEMMGRKSLENCRKFNSGCETSPLEYFTEVGI